MLETAFIYIFERLDYAERCAQLASVGEGIVGIRIEK